MRLISKQELTREAELNAIRACMTKLNIPYELEPHPKGGFRVIADFRHVDFENLIKLLEQHDLMDAF